LSELEGARNKLAESQVAHKDTTVNAQEIAESDINDVVDNNTKGHKRLSSPSKRQTIEDSL
jgi:hypothetical protein